MSCSCVQHTKRNYCRTNCLFQIFERLLFQILGSSNLSWPLRLGFMIYSNTIQNVTQNTFQASTVRDHSKHIILHQKQKASQGAYQLAIFEKAEEEGWHKWHMNSPCTLRRHIQTILIPQPSDCSYVFWRASAHPRAVYSLQRSPSQKETLTSPLKSPEAPFSLITPATIMGIACCAPHCCRVFTRSSCAATHDSGSETALWSLETKIILN